MNWNLYQKKAIRAVCLVSRMCFGFLVTITFLRLTEFVGGKFCVPLQAMLLGNLHTCWNYLQGLGIVCPSDRALYIRITCIPLKKILMPGEQFQKFPFNGYGCSIKIFSSWGDTQQRSIWSTALTASCQVKVVSLLIHWLRCLPWWSSLYLDDSEL